MHERKVQCLSSLKANETLANDFKASKQAFVAFESELKKENLDFILKTLDGDEDKWREIQSQCNTMLDKVKSLEKELSERILGDQMIGFRPSTSRIPTKRRTR